MPVTGPTPQSSASSVSGRSGDIKTGSDATIAFLRNYLNLLSESGDDLEILTTTVAR